MGNLFSKKKTSKTTESAVSDATRNATGLTSFDTSTQRTNPQWSEDMVRNFSGEVDALGKRNPEDFFADADPMQTKAVSDLSNLKGPRGTPWNFDAAGEAIRGTMGRGPFTYDAATGKSASVLDNLKSYISPYMTDVVDASIADMDYDAGRTRAQADLDLTNSGAFGGSGAALAKGEIEGQLSRARGSTLANLRDQAYRFGASLAEGDAGRRQQTDLTNVGSVNRAREYGAGAGERALASDRAGAEGLINLATAFGGEERANLDSTRDNLSMQFDAGEAMRKLREQKLQSPLELAKIRSELMKSLPLELFSGEKQSGSTSSIEDILSHGTSSGTSNTVQRDDPSTMAKIGQVAKIAAMLFSDNRLKRDVTKLYERPDGLGVYLYRYLWSPLWFIGVMAQEALKVKPEAVSVHSSGFLMVDYGRL